MSESCGSSYRRTCHDRAMGTGPDRGTRTRGGFGQRVRAAVETLTPVYFALVMSTGIISVGTQMKSAELLSVAMLAQRLAVPGLPRDGRPG